MNTTATYKFELRSVDAWREPDGGWSWNTSYKLEDELYFCESALTPRKICKALREWGYLSQKSAGRISIYDDGDIYEIQDKSTRKPLLALVPYN